jgi:hypothetical protein
MPKRLAGGHVQESASQKRNRRSSTWRLGEGKPYLNEKSADQKNYFPAVEQQNNRRVALWGKPPLSNQPAVAHAGGELEDKIPQEKSSPQANRGGAGDRPNAKNTLPEIEQPMVKLSFAIKQALRTQSG